MSTKLKVEMHADLRDALAQIMADVTDPQAQVYTQAWLDGALIEQAFAMGRDLADLEEMQANYVLCNIERWRGPIARKVKLILKSIAAGEKTYMSVTKKVTK